MMLSWKNGEIASVEAVSNESMGFGDVTLKDVSTGAILCYRCAVDTESGAWLCFQVPCGG